MREHYLKTWPEYYERVEVGQKKFEVRKNDRDFQVGDNVTLEYYDPNHEPTTDYIPEYKALYFTITYILHGGQFGIETGYCVMQLEPLIIEENKQ